MVYSIQGLDLARPHRVKPLEAPPTEKERMDRLGIDYTRVRKRVTSLYKKHVPEPTRFMLPHVKKIASKSLSAVGSVVAFGLPILGIIRNTAEVGTKARKFLGTLRKAKVLAPLALVSCGIGIAEGIRAVRKAQNKGDAVEAGLGIAENVADVAFIGESLVAGLGHFGAIAPNVVSTASLALVGVGTVLSVATIALCSKNLYDSTKFRKGLTGTFYSLDPEKDHLAETAKFIEKTRPRDFKRRLGVPSGKEFKARLGAIFGKAISDRAALDEADPDEEDRIVELREKSLQSNVKVEKTVGLMKKRLFSKDLGSVLKIVAAVVSIVALAILFFTPLAPIGYGLLALAGIVGLAVVIADMVMARRFRKELEKLVPAE